MRSLVFVVVIPLIFSCTKNKLGGSSTIKGVVAHHGKEIPNARVFVKFNAKEFPGSDTTKYDAKVKADANGNYIIKCYKGNYYLYGFGFDKGVPGSVSGGIPVNVRINEVIETVVAVTE